MSIIVNKLWTTQLFYYCVHYYIHFPWVGAFPNMFCTTIPFMKKINDSIHRSILTFLWNVFSTRVAVESGFDNFYMNRRGLNSIHTAFSIFGLPFQNIPSKFHSHGILLIFDHFIFHRLGSSGVHSISVLR